MSFSEERVGGVEPETVYQGSWDVTVCGSCDCILWPGLDPHEHGPEDEVCYGEDGCEKIAVCPLSALRLVEEELREERDRWKACAALDVTETTFKTWTICRETGDRAVRGECPVHGGDGCLVVVAPVSVVRSVEEELRLERDLRRRAEETRENANAVSLRVEESLDRRTRQHAKLMREHGMLGADRDRLAGEIVKCPVCNGAGNLPANFYDNLPTTDMRTHCRKCAGAGILTRAALAELAALSPVQGEHEQDGGRWSAANCESCHKLGRPCGVHMRLGGRAQDGDTYA